MSGDSLTKYLDQIPPSQKVRERISTNLRERQMLRRLLKLSLDKERVDKPEAASR